MTRIFIILFFINCFVEAQIPLFESNYTKIDSTDNKELLRFSQKFDFTLSYNNTSYWKGYMNHYKIIVFNKNRWQVWESYYKGKKIKFNKIKKQPSQESYVELFASFNDHKLFSIDNEELNSFSKKYSVTDDGDTIFEKRDIVADGATTQFNFTTKNKAKILSLYSSDSGSDSRNRFYDSRWKFEKWWDRIVDVLQQKTK